MTTPNVTEVPGLASIRAAAARSGIDISVAERQLGELMMTNPAMVQDASDRLATLASGLDTSRLNVEQTGKTVQTSGWSGASATAFGTSHAGLVEGMVGSTQDGQALAARLGEDAKRFAGSQNAVMTITASTGAALDMMPTAAPPM